MHGPRTIQSDHASRLPVDDRHDTFSCPARLPPNPSARALASLALRGNFQPTDSVERHRCLNSPTMGALQLSSRSVRSVLQPSERLNRDDRITSGLTALCQGDELMMLKRRKQQHSPRHLRGDSIPPLCNANWPQTARTERLPTARGTPATAREPLQLIVPDSKHTVMEGTAAKVSSSKHARFRADKGLEGQALPATSESDLLGYAEMDRNFEPAANTWHHRWISKPEGFLVECPLVDTLPTTVCQMTSFDGLQVNSYEQSLDRPRSIQQRLRQSWKRKQRIHVRPFTTASTPSLGDGHVLKIVSI